MRLEEIKLHESLDDICLSAYLHDPILGTAMDFQRPAVVICPGGGYISISEKEAEPVALRFLAEGYNAFVLRYSIGAGRALFPAPFIDLARAMIRIRTEAKRFNIDPGRITVCGFSTGGQVAAMLGTGWMDPYLKDTTGVEPALFKPDNLILCYPLLNMERFMNVSRGGSPEMATVSEMVFSAAFGTPFPPEEDMEKWNCLSKVSNQTVPTFIWTVSGDTIIDPQDSFEFARGMMQCKRPVEFHLFQHGHHGMSLGSPLVGFDETQAKALGNSHRWFQLAMKWLDQQALENSMFESELD